MPLQLDAEVVGEPVYTQDVADPSVGEEPIRASAPKSPGWRQPAWLALKRPATRPGSSILATNDHKGIRWTMAELWPPMRSRMSNGAFVFSRARGFNLHCTLEKPERIEALLMVMTCSLIDLRSVEHRSGGLVEQNRSAGGYEKKPTQQPTARWIFCAFGIHEYRFFGEARHK